MLKFERKTYGYRLAKISFDFCQLKGPLLLSSRLRDSIPVDVNQGRIEGGNTEQTALLVKEASRDDIGSYTCELRNDYGIGVSENDVDVDVYCKYIRTLQPKLCPYISTFFPFTS